MTNAAFARADAAMLRGFLRAGLADLAVYEDDSSHLEDVLVMLERDVQLVGEQGQVLGKRDMATLLLSDVPAPSIGGQLTIGDETWTLDRPMEGSSDESMQQWALINA